MHTHSRVLLGLALTLAVVFGSPDMASATPYPPHNTEIPVSYGACVGKYKHGNYGGAYAQFKKTSGTCYAGTKVGVVGFNGAWDSDECVLNNPTGCVGGGWYTAATPGFNIVQGYIVLCGYAGAGGCQTQNYAAL